MIYNASEARALSTGQRAIFTEITLVESHILDAIDDGDLQVLVGPGSDTPVATGFTVNEAYYNAYTNPFVYNDSASIKAREQMNEVIKYFQTKGYTVRVARHLSTSTFNWVVKW